VNFVENGDKMKKVIAGKIVHDKHYDEWSFETDNRIYSADVPTALDELMDNITCNGDNVKITIEVNE
jgi:hypothetical protein